jgi:threonine/homoserine/homoserine lactone efflux protein
MKVIEPFLPKDNQALLGFFISLLGALPLGYINAVGLQILIEKGTFNLILFIFGIISIQFFVLKIVSFGAKWLVKQKQLLTFIDVFTIVFFGLISYYFFDNSQNNRSDSLAEFQLFDYPLLLGWLLNSLNFIQWPYWAGIYIYLFRTNRLRPGQKTNNIFIIGVLLGTFVGMFVFANTTYYFIIQSKLEINSYFNSIFAVLFAGLATLQFIKLVLKKKNKFIKNTPNSV